MRIRLVISFPTLVLTFIVMILSTQTTKVFAANASPSPDFIDATPVQKPLTNEQKQFRTTTDIAPKPYAEPEEALRLGYFHNYHHAVSLTESFVYDDKRLREHNEVLQRASMLYLFQDQERHWYEVGADLLSDDSGSISFARRFITSQTAFRPYTKLGFAIRIDPNDQLAAFLRYRYYRIIAAAGFEQLIHDPMSLRLELQAGASLTSFEGSAVFGLVWSW